MVTVTINTGDWLDDTVLTAPVVITPQWNAPIVDGGTFYPGIPKTLQPNPSGVLKHIFQEPGYYLIKFITGWPVLILVPSTGGPYNAVTLVVSGGSTPPGSVPNQYINGPNGTLWWQEVQYATPGDPTTAFIAGPFGPL